MHCKLDIKQGIINTILTKGLGNTKGVSVEEKKLVVDKEFYGGDAPAKGVATTITDRINRIYSGYPNIAIHNLSAKGYEIRIKVPTALVDTYYDHYIKEYNAQQQAETGINAEGDSSPMYQASLKEANKTKISKESIAKLEAFAEKAKVKILDMSRERSQQLAEEAGSKNAYVTAVANALEGTIEILDGKKDVAFAEESAHILVDILEQTNPSLYKEMFNKIGQYKIFDMVLNDPFYANSKHYQKDGKRNIPLFKKEAMGKLLAEMFAQKEGVSSQISIFTLESESEANKAAILKWFNSVLDWFKNLFKKADYNPFEETTEMLRGNKDFVGTVKNVQNAKSLNSIGNSNAVNATLKVIDALRKPKAQAYFKNIFLKGNKDVFYNKLMQDLGVPKQQVEILKSWVQNNNPTSIEEIELGLMSEMSYTVEVTTARGGNKDLTVKQTEFKGEPRWSVVDSYTTMPLKSFKSEQEANDYILKELGSPTSHYANLTVPGGTNYTENEISTPGIIPSIKGHAQFSTDQGIGWFRSDDQMKGGMAHEEVDAVTSQVVKSWHTGTPTKTRRILELQSDLFQKGRDKSDLISKGEVFDEYNVDVETTQEEFEQMQNNINKKSYTNTDKNKNQFLQLLNKDSNWIPFFIKTIVQDSAKKGYEKVLFPTGDTASKVEGHQTLEEFKRQKENRIKDLEKQKKSSAKYIIVDSNTDTPVKEFDDFIEATRYAQNNSGYQDLAVKPISYINATVDNEIKQLQEELKRVETEGFAALKPIYNFYENRVYRELEKMYSKEGITRIKDEYGNEWYEVVIEPTIDTSAFLFQASNDTTLFNTINNIANKVIEKENKFFVNDTEVKHTFNKSISKDETIQTINSNGMGDIHSILNRYIDENGVLRQIPLDKKAHQLGTTDAAYNLLDKHIFNILNEYPVNTKFIYNTILFNEAKDLAGKADFIAILPDNSVDVLTWDFLADREKGISKNTREELQKYLGRIKVILKEAYNVKKINHARAIPVLINFNFKNNKYTFKSIQVANTKVEDIKQENLLPIPASDDATGNEEIDSFIQRLNSLYKVINDTPVIEGRRDIKYSELSAIYKAIRNLQLKKDFKPLFQQVRIQIDNTQQLLNKHQEMFEAGAFDNYSKEELNEVAKRLDRLSENLEIYKDLDLFFKDFFLTDAKYEEDLQTVRRLSIESRDIINKAEKLIFKFAVKYIADPRKIYDLTSPEATVNAIDKNFRTMSSAPTKAVQTYYLLAEEARNKAELETDALLDELKTIQNNVADWAKTQGLKSFDYTKYLLKKDNKDRVVNQLIDKYSYEFYTTLKDKIKAKDTKWIKQNIDIEAFKQWNEEYRKIKLAQIEETVYLGSPDEQEEQRKFEKESVLRQTDIETGKAYLNYMGVKQFPTDAWYSKEYKEVLKHKPLLDLFNYATKVNTIAKNAGYLDSSNARTFLPFIRKNFAERVIVGGNYNILNNALASLSVNDEMVGYGNFNPITNEIEDTIPKYFTRDISETKKDSFGEEYQDYGNVSLDIFKNLGIYTKQVVDYREKKNIEGLANILYFVEKNKKSLQTNQFGNLITNAINHPNESNEINAKFFKNFLKNHLYGQKYITTDSSDMLLGVPESAVKFWNKTVEKFNKTLGTNIPVISEEVASRNLSAVKTIDTLNKFFTMKTLGINLASSIAQFMGGNFQAIVNSGKYWTKAQWFASEWNASSHKILGGKENIHLALMKTFLPLGDEKVIRDLEKMSLIKANQHSTSDILMTLMRKADNIIQYTNFLAMMDNAIVIDGKLVNARTYYNESAEYQNRYNLSAAERKELENKYESKIKELVDKYGVVKNSKIVNGKLVIEGASTDSIYKYRSLVQQVGKRLAGNISSNDENQIRMTVLGRSFMMFKNWIPGALYQRFQPLTYIVGTDSYEWGRMRMTYNYFFSAIVPKVKSISAVISGTEEGLKIMSDLYEKERKNYYEKHNKELHISKTDFYDLVRQNLQAQIKDVILLLTLLALFLSAKAMAPDDDEDKATKNAYGYALRTIDNVVNEMSFYYNPANIQHVLGGNLFPALGVFSDVTKALTNIGQEIFGMVFGVDEWKESAKPLKYIMKTFPVSKEMLNYLAIFYPETATEMGIIINSKSRK